MNVEDALQMCGASSVDFTGGEWCYAANILAEEVTRLREVEIAAWEDFQHLEAAVLNSDRCDLILAQFRAFLELAVGSSAAGRRSEPDSDGSPRSVGERQGWQPTADTRELGRLRAMLQEAREIIGVLIECPNQDAPMHSGCSFCAAWQVEQAVAWVRDSYPASTPDASKGDSDV